MNNDTVNKPLEKLMIIGGTGSLGYKLVDLLSSRYSIIIMSRDEDKQWNMKKLYPHLTFVLCDIREKGNVTRCILRFSPDYIILASALKHIDQCEENIDQCILTNLYGIQNVINSVIENLEVKSLENLKSVVFISTDKACSPVNVYGMCKSIGERIVAEKSLYDLRVKFVTVRYGNVLYSRGSLFEFYDSIGKKDLLPYFPLTTVDMTRFFITLEQCIDLILYAMLTGKTGCTYVHKIHSYLISDIADEYSKMYNKPVKVVGQRPGEKIHEVLINESERCRTVEYDNYYEIHPCYKNFDTEVSFEYEYTSKDNVCSDRNVIKNMIIRTHLKK